MKLSLLIHLLLSLLFSISAFGQPSESENPDVFSQFAYDRIYFLPDDNVTAAMLSSALEEADVVHTENAFQVRSSGLQSEEGNLVSRIQTGYLQYGANPQQVSRWLARQPGIQWAEPVPIPHTMHTPNDPEYSQHQGYLNWINAPQAWDITTGSEDVVIAIVDSGTDYQHSDLLPNVWINPNETENDQDDSGSGKIDDIHGWDFYENNNNPIPSSSTHGTHVAGIAAAATNNGIGIASLGYNTRFMPLKVGDGVSGRLPFAYDAIIYAAEQGADIINCSWGSKNYSRAAEAVVDYAYSLGSLVVAAAGNDNTTDTFYPAGYASAISVGSVDLNTQKSGFSTYGTTVSVSAPGNQIYSTILDNEYKFENGTSMAAPVVSALAALIKAANPDYSIDQVRAQIQATAVPMPTSSNWRYQTGTGYIDAAAALGVSKPFAEIIDYSFTDRRGNNDGFLEPGENIELNLHLKGLGIPKDATLRVFAMDNYMEVSRRDTEISQIPTGDSLYVPDIPVRVSSRVALQSDIRSLLRIEFVFEDVTYSRTVKVLLNPSNYTFDINTINLTLGGEGQIGFLDGPGGDEGTSFEIPGQASTAVADRQDILNKPLLFEGGLMISNNPGGSNPFVANSIRNAAGGVDRDFLIREPFLVQRDEDNRWVRSRVVFTDGNAGNNAYRMTITQTAWATNEADNDQYIILNYHYHNADTVDYRNFVGGLFLDYDALVSRKNNNYGYYEAEDDILVVAENNSGDDDVLMLGVAIMSGFHTPFVIDNTGNSGIFGINDGFTMQEKATSLSQGMNSTARNNTDISVVASPAPVRINANENHDETFVLAWGLGYEQLKTQINNARERYRDVLTSSPHHEPSELPVKTSISSAYPNPFNPSTNINITIHQPGSYSLDVYDVTGRRVRELDNRHFEIGQFTIPFHAQELASGIYMVTLKQQGLLIHSRKVTVIK